MMVFVVGGALHNLAAKFKQDPQCTTTGLLCKSESKAIRLKCSALRRNSGDLDEMFYVGQNTVYTTPSIYNLILLCHSKFKMGP